MKQIIRLFRPHQYIKNLFIFAPLFFTFSCTIQQLIDLSIAFILFSLLASSVYIFNDFKDIEEDKQHPQKKHRPLASGKVKISSALFLIVILSGFSLTFAFFFNQKMFIVLVVYFFLNLAYSIKLKHIPIIDIFVIATGFVLRLFAGAAVIENQLSMWIIIMTFLLALFLAVAKRRDDLLLAKNGNKTRKNIDGYNMEFVNAVMVFMAGVIVVAYVLYTVSDEVMQKFHTEYLYFTASFVILGIIRYMQITFVEEKSGSPTKVVLKDRFLKFTIFFWLVSFFIIVKGV